jgi:hypothetical protein
VGPEHSRGTPSNSGNEVVFRSGLRDVKARCVELAQTLMSDVHLVEVRADGGQTSRAKNPAMRRIRRNCIGRHWIRTSDFHRVRTALTREIPWFSAPTMRKSSKNSSDMQRKQTGKLTIFWGSITDSFGSTESQPGWKPGFERPAANSPHIPSKGLSLARTSSSTSAGTVAICSPPRSCQSALLT